MTDIELAYAKTFAGNSGQRVLAHMRKITIERVLGANATDAELRGLEAQRSLVHQIENLINRGK
jgi:hypothetical protein